MLHKSTVNQLNTLQSNPFPFKYNWAPSAEALGGNKNRWLQYKYKRARSLHNPELYQKPLNFLHKEWHFYELLN